jgi:hypothetical protein
VFRSATATNVLSRSRSRLIIGRFALIIYYHLLAAHTELVNAVHTQTSNSICNVPPWQFHPNPDESKNAYELH